jgi:hypothetical protein
MGTWESSPEYGGIARLSPDGKRVAFGWNTKRQYELRVADVAGPKYKTVFSNPEVEWIEPIGFSSSGEQILAKVQTKSRTGEIAWITIADGTRTVLRTGPWELCCKPELTAYRGASDDRAITAGQSEQASNKRGLSGDVALRQPPDLSPFGSCSSFRLPEAFATPSESLGSLGWLGPAALRLYDPAGQCCSGTARADIDNADPVRRTASTPKLPWGMTGFCPR